MNTGVRFYLFSTVIAIQPMMTVLRTIPFCISCPLTNESWVSCHRQPSMRGFDYFVIVEGLISWVNKHHNDAEYHPVVIYGNEIMVPYCFLKILLNHFQMVNREISSVGARSGVGVTKTIFSVPLFSKFFQHYQNTGYLLNISFISGRCRRSSAAVTPVKNEWDSNNLKGTFARSKILLAEKLTNGALVTPTPGIESSHMITWKDISFVALANTIRRHALSDATIFMRHYSKAKNLGGMIWVTQASTCRAIQTSINKS